MIALVLAVSVVALVTSVGAFVLGEMRYARLNVMLTTIKANLELLTSRRPWGGGDSDNAENKKTSSSALSTKPIPPDQASQEAETNNQHNGSKPVRQNVRLAVQGVEYEDKKSAAKAIGVTEGTIYHQVRHQREHPDEDSFVKFLQNRYDNYSQSFTNSAHYKAIVKKHGQFPPPSKFNTVEIFDKN